jgi:hypothetical protein
MVVVASPDTLNLVFIDKQDLESIVSQLQEYLNNDTKDAGETRIYPISDTRNYILSKEKVSHT